MGLNRRLRLGAGFSCLRFRLLYIWIHVLFNLQKSEILAPIRSNSTKTSQISPGVITVLKPRVVLGETRS